MIKVDSIIESTPNVFQGLTKTFFTYEGNVSKHYLFHKPENGIKVGDTLEGMITPDKNGDLKFKREYNTQGSGTSPAASTQGSSPSGNKYAADPIKLKQERDLETFRNLSIQRQTVLKCSVELIVAGKREYADLIDTYNDLMMLTNPKQTYSGPIEPSATEPPSKELLSVDKQPATEVDLTSYEEEDLPEEFFQASDE